MPRTPRNGHKATSVSASVSAQYEVDVGASIPRRIATYLVWAAQHMPKRAISLQVVAKTVFMVPRTPSLDGKEVARLRSSISGARKILLNEFRRGLFNIQGAGLRATVDSEDLATTQFEIAARRAVNSIETLDQNRAALKLSEISNPEVRARVQRVSAACRTLTSGEVLEKLRLPAAEED